MKSSRHVKGTHWRHLTMNYTCGLDVSAFNNPDSIIIVYEITVQKLVSCDYMQQFR